MGPATHTGLGAISMKVEWVQGAPLHSHTQTLYAGTRDITWRQAYMPTTIAVAHGLLSPMPVYGRRFSAMGERVNQAESNCMRLSLSKQDAAAMHYDFNNISFRSK